MITVHVTSHLMETSQSFHSDNKVEKYLKQIKKHHDKYPDTNEPKSKLIVKIDSSNLFNQV